MPISVSNAAALQSAVNAPPADGLIYLETSFVLSSPIVINHANTTATIETDPALSSPVTLTVSTANTSSFQISNNTNITFSNVIIDGSNVGGNITISGSSWVYFQSGAVLQNCGMTLSGNVSAAGVNVSNAIFVLWGGTITNCINSGNIWGGGIYVGYNGQLRMYGGTISNCHNTVGTTGYGGGVCIQNGEMDMDGGIISNNSATYLGGGIYCELDGSSFSGADLEISGGTVENNSAQQGGGVFMDYGELSLYGTGAITNNTATVSGGGLYVYNGAWANISSQVTHNTAPAGGGIYAWGTYPFQRVNIGGNALIQGNSASATDGGGIWIYGQLTMTAGTVQTNEAANNGGGLLLAGYNHSLTGGTIENNTALENGGGICCDSSTNPTWLTLAGVTVTENTANNSGGGIYDLGNPVATAQAGSLTVSAPTVISQNVALNGGGIALDNGSALILNGGTVSNNTAADGGGFLLRNTATGTFSAGSVTQNMANTYGGGIYLSDGTTVTQTGGELSENAANVSGGAVYVA